MLYVDIPCFTISKPLWEILAFGLDDVSINLPIGNFLIFVIWKKVYWSYFSVGNFQFN